MASDGTMLPWVSAKATDTHPEWGDSTAQWAIEPPSSSAVADGSPVHALGGGEAEGESLHTSNMDVHVFMLACVRMRVCTRTCPSAYVRVQICPRTQASAKQIGCSAKFVYTTSLCTLIFIHGSLLCSKLRKDSDAIRDPGFKHYENDAL